MTTPSFKTCSSGHYYASSLDACPYCTDSAGGNTASFSGSDGDKTQLVDGQNTKTFNSSGNGNETVQVNINKPAFKSQDFDNDRTMIRPPGTTTKSENEANKNENNEAPQARHTRKLTGWLVSFTLDPMGIDFRLYEGQNNVGRDISCSVRIINDGSISSRHATILFRNGQFYLRDEMAANPSFINGSELPPGATQEIKDNDRLKFGGSEFLLKTAF